MTWLFVGLGNPGKNYEKTRHNTGFNVVNAFSEHVNISWEKKKTYAFGKGYLDGIPIFLLKPLTFMNLSGKAVSEFCRYNNTITSEKTVIIYDDLDLPVGKLRLKWDGSGGGHKGVASIINEMGTKNFFHLKIGIGRPPLKELVESYVLDRFSSEELLVINEAIEKSVFCLLTLIKEGPQIAMNKFNG